MRYQRNKSWNKNATKDIYSRVIYPDLVKLKNHN